MNDPIPTPYDILNPPSFAWEPSLLTWTLVIIFGVFGFWLVKKFSNPGARRPSETARDLLRLELGQIALRVQAASDGRSALSQAAQAMRRFLSLSESRDLISQTAQELKKYAQTKPELSPLVELLAETEASRFSKDPISPELAQKILAELDRQLTKYLIAMDQQEQKIHAS